MDKFNLKKYLTEGKLLNESEDTIKSIREIVSNTDSVKISFHDLWMLTKNNGVREVRHMDKTWQNERFDNDKDLIKYFYSKIYNMRKRYKQLQSDHGVPRVIVYTKNEYGDWKKQ